jgi:hypothetical protein
MMTFILWASLLAETSSQQVIVIPGPGESKKEQPNVTVTSGTDAISGSPFENIKSARRSWDQECTKWKNEMRALNKNNLIQASCGAPKLATETIQSQKYYTFSSQAKFKVRVSQR